eukprot:gene25584-32056_t
MEYFRQGNSQFVDEDYEECVEDFNSAIAFNDGLELAHYRKGVVLFELEMYKSAKASFETDDATIVPSTDSEPVKRVVPTAAPQTVPVVAPQPKQALVLPVRYQYYQSDATLSISVLAKNLAAEDVVVDIQPDHLRVVIKYTTFAGESREEVVIDKELYGTVDIAKSKFVVLKPKVEITLVKIEKDVWSSLEHSGAPRLARPQGTPAPTVADEPASVEMDVDGNPVATQPASKRPKAYASSKDWDKVGSEISKELEKDKGEGDEALNSLFATIYKDADQETKMAMKKSFQTSGGTVLSTNWKEVKEKDYEKERQAPKGMEWRNWEGSRLEQKDD